MTKKDNRDFKNCTKCWIYDPAYVDGDLKVKDHCHITRKYSGSVHRDCDVKVKVNHKISVTFHNLKNYDSHLHHARTRQIQF